jgi:hypothetical protein
MLILHPATSLSYVVIQVVIFILILFLLEYRDLPIGVQYLLGRIKMHYTGKDEGEEHNTPFTLHLTCSLQPFNHISIYIQFTFYFPLPHPHPPIPYPYSPILPYPLPPIHLHSICILPFPPSPFSHPQHSTTLYPI